MKRKAGLEAAIRGKEKRIVCESPESPEARVSDEIQAQEEDIQTEEQPCPSPGAAEPQVETKEEEIEEEQEDTQLPEPETEQPGQPEPEQPEPEPEQPEPEQPEPEQPEPEQPEQQEQEPGEAQAEEAEQTVQEEEKEAEPEPLPKRTASELLHDLQRLCDSLPGDYSVWEKHWEDKVKPTLFNLCPDCGNTSLPLRPDPHAPLTCSLNEQHIWWPAQGDRIRSRRKEISGSDRVKYFGERRMVDYYAGKVQVFLESQHDKWIAELRQIGKEACAFVS